jgi:hypothetical protein
MARVDIHVHKRKVRGRDGNHADGRGEIERPRVGSIKKDNYRTIYGITQPSHVLQFQVTEIVNEKVRREREKNRSTEGHFYEKRVTDSGPLHQQRTEAYENHNYTMRTSGSTYPYTPP